MARRRTLCLCLTLGLALTSQAVPLSADSAVNEEAGAAMRSFLSRPAVAHQYRALRRLEASGSGHRAWLDAQTDFTLASGFVYQITAEGGSGFIRSRVLRSLLDEEQKLIARGGGPAIAISTANYQFSPEGINDEGLAVVGLHPLRKDRSLIAGRMFLTVDGDLLRIEGRLAKNPSFWVTRVDVVRAYRRLNGVLMPVSLETHAQLRLFGSSALRMTYSYSHIDDRAVDDEKDRD